MTWSVGNEANERAPRTSVWQDAIQDIAYKLDHSEIGALAVPSKVVLFPGAAAIKQHNQSSCMIIDMQPVTNVQAVAIDGHGFALDSVETCYRDELLRELIWPIII